MMKYQYVWGEYSKDSISQETKNYFINKLQEQFLPEYHCDDNKAGETETSYFSRTPLIINLSIDPYYRAYFNIPNHKDLPEKIYLEIHASCSVLSYDPQKQPELLRVSGFNISLININDMCFINKNRHTLIKVDTCIYTGYLLYPTP